MITLFLTLEIFTPKGVKNNNNKKDKLNVPKSTAARIRYNDEFTD